LIAKLSSQISNLIASLLSGTLLFLAFPQYDFWWLAWFGFQPLFLVLYRESAKLSFLWSYVCGIVFFTGIFNWVLEVPGYNLLHHAILIPYLGIYFGVFGWIFSYLKNRLNPTAAFVSAPFLWILLEYVRSHVSFLALPWALLAHSQYQIPPVIQIASFTGAYGVSFLIVAANSALCLAVLPRLSFIKNFRIYNYALPSKRVRSTIILAASLVLIFALLFGHLRISNLSPGRHIKVAVVQGNINREQKRDIKKNARFIMQQHRELTLKASRYEPELIVWPEASTPGYLFNNSILMRQMTELVKKTGTHFLVGSSEHAKFTGDPKDKTKTGNSALYFSPTGKILAQYLKIHLVPFGEYLPYQETIAWPEFIVPRNKYFEIPGKEYTLFDISESQFGVIICWEIVFSELFRTFVRNGADFMLNITNEGWFGAEALYQMVAISVFRAVENGVAIARAANTGVSCFIDPVGRITGRVSNGGQDIFVEGFLTQEMRISKTRTFYTFFGDLFAYSCIAISVVSLFVTRAKHRSRRQLTHRPVRQNES